MALSIKTQEADRLARDLSRLTGETVTQAVTVALRERRERTRAQAAKVETTEEFVERVMAYTAKMREGIDFRPITPEEWLDAGGDDLDHELAAKEKAQAQAKS